MANLKSSKKGILITERNRERSLYYKNRLKTYIKKAVNAIQTQAEEKAELVKQALQIIDKTAGKGILKKKTAARKKSRLMIALNTNLIKGIETVKSTKKTVKKTVNKSKKKV